MEIELDFDAIPLELRQKKQWVVASLNYEGKKVPLNATDILLRDRSADISDPDTWTTFEKAVAYYDLYVEENAFSSYKILSVEYALTKDDGLIFVDFDCHSDGLEEQQRAELEQRYRSMVRVAEQYKTYGEVSISGRGRHYLARGLLDAEIQTGRAKEMPIEIYDRDRFIIFTGAKLNDYDISDDEYTLNLIRSSHSIYFEKKSQELLEWEKKPSAPIRDTPLLPDEEVLRVALRDEKFNLLWNDRWAEVTKYDGTHYSSQHYGDKALMDKLAFYCGCCPTQMERLFRQSPTYKAYGKNGKWVKYESDIKKDIKSACAKCKAVYRPSRKAKEQIQVQNFLKIKRW